MNNNTDRIIKKTRNQSRVFLIKLYVPGAIRTPDRRLRRALLYPAELLGHHMSNTLERVKGIGPSPQAWEAGVLPLNYTRTIPLTARNIISHELMKIKQFLIVFLKNVIFVVQVSRAILLK